MTERLDIAIDKEGNVDIHVTGVKGPRCMEIERAFAAALGGEPVTSERTGEYYETKAEVKSEVVQQVRD